MTVLVTGASGFVGLNVVEALLARGESVIAASIEPVPPAAKHAFAALQGELVEAQCDVREAAALGRAFKLARIERVFHAAALTPRTERERREAAAIIDTNIMGTLAVLEAARQAGVVRFVFPSSISVYGAGIYAEAPLDEEARASPQSLYGITKYAAECLVLRYQQLWGLDVVCGRITSVFGPWEYATGARDTRSPSIQLASLAAAGREARILRGRERDSIYSRNAASAFMTLMFAPACRHGVYHVSHGAVWSVEELCRRLARTFPAFSYRVVESESESNIDYNDSQTRRRAAVTVDRLKADLEYRPPFTLDQALDDFAGWVVAHSAELPAAPD